MTTTSVDDVFAPSDVAHLPQKVVSIKSRNGLSYSSANSNQIYIEFEIGASLGYYLAEDVVLSFDFSLTSSDGVVYNMKPQNAGGIGNLIHQLSIWSINDGVLIEEINDYEVLNSLLMSWNNGSDREMSDGEFKKMSIQQCYTNDYQTRQPFVSPTTIPADPTTILPNPTYQSQKVQLPIRLSHLLNASQCIPVGAIGGCRIRFLLNPDTQLLSLHGDEIDLNTLAVNLNMTDTGAWEIPVSVSLVCEPNATTYLIPPDGLEVEINGGAADATATMTGGAYDAAGLIAEFLTQADSVIATTGLAAGDLVQAAGAGADQFIWTYTDTAVSGFDITITGDYMAELYSLATTGPLASPGPSSSVDIDYEAPVSVIILPAGNYANAAAVESAINDRIVGATAGGVGTGIVAAGFSVLNLTAVPSAGSSGTIDWRNALGGGLDLSLGANAFGGTALCTDAAPFAVADGATETATLIAGLDTENMFFVDQQFVAPSCGNPQDFSTCPFLIGTRLQVTRNDGTWSEESPPIAGLSTSATSTGIRISFATAWVITGTATGNDKPLRTFLPDDLQVNYNIDNVSLEVPLVSVPASYQSALYSAVNSEQGLVMDMKAFQLIRSNVMGGSTLADLHLPFISTKAKGILSVPHEVNTGTYRTRYCCDNFTNLNMNRYWYSYYNQRVPNRGIDTNLARQNSLSQELISEQDKVFAYCLDKLGSLDGYGVNLGFNPAVSLNPFNSKTFFVGRSVGVNNSTMNMINSNTSLSIEATSTAGAITTTQNVNSYSSCVNQIVMRPEGVILLK